MELFINKFSLLEDDFDMSRPLTGAGWILLLFLLLGAIPEVVRLLLAAGSDPFAKNAVGKDASDSAEARPRTSSRIVIPVFAHAGAKLDQH